MKKLSLLSAILFVCHGAFSQDSLPQLKDLAVPNSPAFILLDAAPTNIETPLNPKSFTLGVVQNFDLDTKWFDNYSMEFTPYWWVRGGERSIYSFAGLKTSDKGATYHQAYCSGLKFTSFSVALLNKDVIADTFSAKQKVFSIGVRTTFLRIYPKSYASELNEALKKWQPEGQDLLEKMNKVMLSLRPDDSLGIDSVSKLYHSLMKKGKIKKMTSSVIDILHEKPIFNWDFAFATSQYGVGDSTWKAGKTGLWTTISSFVPVGKEKPNRNYFDMLLTARFKEDNYAKDDSDRIVYAHTIDLGGKIGIEIDRFSLAGEFLYRMTSSLKDPQKRITGIINYKISDTLYATGTFGQDIGPEKKIITLFGINWGFGSEKTKLSD